MADGEKMEDEGRIHSIRGMVYSNGGSAKGGRHAAGSDLLSPGISQSALAQCLQEIAGVNSLSLGDIADLLPPHALKARGSRATGRLGEETEEGGRHAVGSDLPSPSSHSA